MLTIRTRVALRDELARFRADASVLGDGRVALVLAAPGDDLASLAGAARRHADVVVASGASRGGPDVRGIDLLFAPDAGEMRQRRGAAGVRGDDTDDALTLAARLLHVVAPELVVVSGADERRARAISAMVHDLDFGVRVVVVPDGQVVYLSPSPRGDDAPPTSTAPELVTATPPALPPMPSWTQVSDKRRAHIARVTGLLAEWAPRLARDEAEAAALRDVGAWHDALRDAPESLLRELTGDHTSPADLLHGPAAAELLARDGETRAEVLDAVRWHTIGHAGWGRVGRALYMADFLEPGRRFASADRAFLAAHAPHDFDGAFRQVVRMRLEWSLREGMEIFPETAALWNAVR